VSKEKKKMIRTNNKQRGGTINNPTPTPYELENIPSSSMDEEFPDGTLP
jgi:hypothetical protein